MYALADCNNFFVSCERVFRPDLEGKAVVVLSNNDGCAISRSNEAKKLGIRMGQPFFEFRNMVLDGKVTVFSSNFYLYGDMSKRVQATLSRFSPSLEVYSIDESFIDLTGVTDVDFDRWAKFLSAECRRCTGIPVSVGVAPTKTLAKIASKLCKQYPKTMGGCYMHRPEDVEKVLRRFPVEDIWGIGRRYSKRFRNYYGINTAYDFVSKGEAWVAMEMGITGVRTWKELKGIPSIGFEDEAPDRKQIMVSRSFSKDLSDLQEISEQVSLFCSLAVDKLRKQHSCCSSATVFAVSNRFRESVRQYTGSRLVTFNVATDSIIEINSAIMNALRDIFRDGIGYKRAGVILQDIVSADSVQQCLFDDVDRDKHYRLMQAVDAINRKNGKESIGVASRSLDGIHMHREHLSPCYTTRLEDILTIKC